MMAIILIIFLKTRIVIHHDGKLLVKLVTQNYCEFVHAKICFRIKPNRSSITLMCGRINA